MKIGIRVIYESLSPVMLRTPKNAFDFIPPALGSPCHLLDTQQIFVGWTDGWIDGQMNLLASCPLCFPVSASFSNILLILLSLTLDEISRGGKVFSQEAIKQKGSQDWYPRSGSRLVRVLSNVPQLLSFSTLARA